MTLYILLPAYNEEQNIEELILNIHKFLTARKLTYRIIVVDDGSIDQTAKIVRKLRRSHQVSLVKHRINKGLGEAMNTGFLTALKYAKNSDLLITMDADNTHDLAAIPLMINKYRQSYNLILASRFAAGGGDEGIGGFRRFMSHQAGVVFQLLFPIPGVREYTCSYRAYSPKLIRQAVATYQNHFIREKGFNCMLEILVKLAKLQPKIAEVPFILHYQRKKSKSKMDIKKTLLRYLTIALTRQKFT